MKQKKKIWKGMLGIILCLAMVLGLMPGMDLPALAAYATVWESDQNISANQTIDGLVIAKGGIILTIPKGVTLTVNGNIKVNGSALTIAGEGALIVKGDDGYDGGSGKSGISGDIIVNGASVSATGGNGGTGSGYGAGPGGIGVSGDVTVESGSVTTIGGNGGDSMDNAGGNGGLGISGSVIVNGGEVYAIGGKKGNGGEAKDGVAVFQSITGKSCKESDDGSTWTSLESGKFSTKRFVRVESIEQMTVSYNGNGYTAGKVPADDKSYESGAEVTVLGNGSLEKTGCTFTNWNTADDGTGKSYAAGDKFEITSSTELFAQWKHDNTIYEAEDNFSIIDSASYKLGNDVFTGQQIKTKYQIQVNELPIVGVAYNAENQCVMISFPNDVKVLIPAKGTSDPSGFTVKGSGNSSDPYYFEAVYDKCTVTYDGNGSIGGTAPVDAKSPYEMGEAVAVLDNTGNLVKTDNAFDGWNTKADGTGNAYKAGDTFAISEDTTLYAQWKKNVPQTEHKVSFNVQGHGTAPKDQIVKDGDKATKPEDPKADGYTFEGWFKEEGCTNVWDFDTAVTSDTTLFAKWTEGDPSVTKYTVKFDVQSHGTAPADQVVDKDSKVTKPTDPAAEGYTFGGWFKEAACTNAWNFDTDTATADITLFAKWTAGQTEYLVVPEDLSDDNISSEIIERYGTVTEVKAVIKEAAGVAPEQTGNYELYDAQIIVIENGVSRPATAADITSEGLEAIFPYPEGSNQNQVFAGVHMIGEDSGEFKAGDIEQLTFTNEDDGLHARVHGLSPVIITWKEPTPEPTPTDTGVTLNLSETSLSQGMEKALKATTVPAGAAITWTSSDTKIAYVDGNGVVMGLKPGTATITAKITVDGKEYSASCKVTVVPAGTPIIIPSGGGEHTHKFVWNTIEATEDTDGELRYQCETCGEIQTRVPLTAYNVFNKNTTEKIRKAPKDATVRIETNKWISFHKMVMEALAERKDVTLEISFLDGEYQGNRCTVVIPKGTDTTTLVDKNGFTGFLFLGGKFGMKTN